MKLKQRPDDFHVEELSSVTPGTSGPHAYYRLEKRSLGTAEAIQSLCKQLRVDPRRVRYGGLKDRHAVTIQYLTIEDGPRRDLRDEHFHLKYRGQTPEPYGPQSFSGNRFAITIRDLPQAELDASLSVLEEVKSSLIANYFDDQRFGSVNEEGEFVARYLIQGDEETALKLALTAPYEFDRSKEKQFKALLRNQWGNWSALRNLMPRGHLQAIATHLAHQPDDFRDAFAKIPFFLKNMYLSAFQSHIWNQVLSHWMVAHFDPSQLVAVHQKKTVIPMPKTLTLEQRASLLTTNIPLPSSRLKITENDPLAIHFNSVMATENLQLSEMRLKHFREPFFSRGDRPAFYFLGELQHEIGWDKWNKGNRKLKLMFTLPRGSYATLLVKRITATSQWRD